MKLIEKNFPLYEVNLLAEYDMLFLKKMPKDIIVRIGDLLKTGDLKGADLPKIRSLMYYPARRPPTATRAVTLASVLDSSVAIDIFLKAVGFEKVRELARRGKIVVSLYMVSPDRELVRGLVGDPASVVVVDPMAGGGSIPLESLRLGFRTIAGDYNPVAYLILRATIEFPAKYGRRLYELVLREAQRMLEHARRELGRFYDEKTKRYIFFLGAEHDCGGIIPLISQPLLSRRQGIYVRPEFNAEDKAVEFRITSQPPPPINLCPYCGKPVSVEMLRRRWVQKHVELLSRLLEGDEKAVEEIEKTYLLAAVQFGRGRFREPSDLDRQLFREAARELARIAKEENVLDYLPIAEIPDENKVFKDAKNMGLKHWYQLFNPRQLLALYKLIKYVRSRAVELRENLGEIGVAASLYLALAIGKIVNFNNIFTQWDASSSKTRDMVGSQYALGRKVRLGYDFCEGAIPYMDIPWALEVEEDEGEEVEEEEAEEFESKRGGILPVLKFLGEELEGLWKDGLDSIYLWDARELDRILPQGSVDLVNVDPPYYDQHDYAGITEFFWVVIQQALRPMLEVLFPADRIYIDWDPSDPRIPRELEIGGSPPPRVGSVSRFGEQIRRFLEAASKILKPDGLLVMWYAYGKLHGWEELFYRFYEAGYAVTKTWQVWSESRQRRIALQSSAFFTSIVIVARPNAKRKPVLSADDHEFIEDVRSTVTSSMNAIVGSYGMDLLREALVVSIADGFAAVTRYTLPASDQLTQAYNYRRLADRALEVSVNAIMELLASRVGARGLDIRGLDPTSRLYLFLLIASDERLRVPYDFSNRVYQVLRAPSLELIQQNRGSEGVLTLRSPDAMATLRVRIGRCAELLRSVRETITRYGVRAAEDVVAQADRNDVALAYYLTALCWRKLGIGDGGERDRILRVLGSGL